MRTGGETERQRYRGPKIQGMQIDAEAERQRGRGAKIQGGKKLPGQRYRGPKIQGGKIQSQKFRVGWNRREFKSVNYNYLNQL